MHLLRASPILRSVAARSSPRVTTRTTVSIQHRFYAHQSYGGADDDPKGGDPQNQGPNPSADLEHPGPPPPDVGKGTGGGPTKADGGGHNSRQNQSSGGGDSGSGSGSKGEVSSGGKASNGAQPKIHSSKVPENHEESEDVKQHNKEMDNRRLGGAQDKHDDGGKQNVGKGFWSGHGGADRQP